MVGAFWFRGQRHLICSQHLSCDQQKSRRPLGWVGEILVIIMWLCTSVTSFLCYIMGRWLLCSARYLLRRPNELQPLLSWRRDVTSTSLYEAEQCRCQESTALRDIELALRQQKTQNDRRQLLAHHQVMATEVRIKAHNSRNCYMLQYSVSKSKKIQQFYMLLYEWKSLNGRYKNIKIPGDNFRRECNSVWLPKDWWTPYKWGLIMRVPSLCSSVGVASSCHESWPIMLQSSRNLNGQLYFVTIRHVQLFRAPSNRLHPVHCAENFEYDSYRSIWRPKSFRKEHCIHWMA